MTPYERYCLLRDEAGVKDKNIADAIGISRSTFSDWKSGRSTPKADKMIRIAKYFDVSYPYLMCLTDERVLPPHVIDVTPIADLIMESYEKHLEETGELYGEDVEEPSQHDIEEVEKAIDLYTQYRNSSPEIQAAIETLLKSQQRSS